MTTVQLSQQRIRRMIAAHKDEFFTAYVNMISSNFDSFKNEYKQQLDDIMKKILSLESMLK